MIVDEIDQDIVRQVARQIAEADFILVGAGAGMSADAGFDYHESVEFLRRYPYLREIGVHCRYDSIGFKWPTKTMQWAFYARHLQDILYTPPPNPKPYLDLDSLTAHADRWVITSNADNLFLRMGFNADRIWTRQGTYANLQCLTPCVEKVWDARPAMEQILPHIDSRTGELPTEDLVPICPYCKGDVFLNVRGGTWFVEKPFEVQQQKFQRWLGGVSKGRLLAIEIGSGFSTPSVIRWPMEAIVASHPNAHLIRINPLHASVPKTISKRSTCLAISGASFLESAKDGVADAVPLFKVAAANG